MLELLNCDNIDLMRMYGDGYFDLAIVDPPYGLDFSSYQRGSGGKRLKERYTSHGKKDWDNSIPGDEYFNELFRVSKHQIIWGGNYFFDYLPSSQCFIFWYKKNPVENFADGEFAWCSFSRPAFCINYPYYGNINSEEDRIHPTQKPIAMYDILIKKYVDYLIPKEDKNGVKKILDTHLGSGSIAISVDKFNKTNSDIEIELTGSELDNDIYKKMLVRVKNRTKSNYLGAKPTQIITDKFILD